MGSLILSLIQMILLQKYCSKYVEKCFPIFGILETKQENYICYTKFDITYNAIFTNKFNISNMNREA